MRLVCALLVGLAAALGPSYLAAQAQVCRDTDTIDECAGRISSRITGEDVEDTSQATASLQDQEAELAKKPTGIAALAPGLTSAINDFLPALAGALSFTPTATEDGAAGFETNLRLPLGATLQKLRLQTVLREPTIYEPVRTALPEPTREERSAALSRELGDFDDVRVGPASTASARRSSPRCRRSPLRTGSLNLGQGFPDTDGPARGARGRGGGHPRRPQPVPARPRHPGAARGRSPRTSGASTAWSSTRTPRCWSPTGATEAIAAALLALCEPGRRGRRASSRSTTPTPPASPWPAPTRRVVTLRAAGLRGRPGRSSRPRSAPRTRLVLLNTPHNPTGKVFDRAELELIAAHCVERDVLAVTDEVYEHLVFDGASTSRSPRCPAWRERTLTISSAGKTFSFTGWKIGWACGPPELVARGPDGQAVPHLRRAARRSSTPSRTRSGCPTRTSRASPRTSQAKRDRLCAGLEAAGLEVHRPRAPTSSTPTSARSGRRTGSRSAWALPAARRRGGRPAPWSSTTTRRSGGRSCASPSASATR